MQKTAYRLRISYWSSDVCSSKLRKVARILLGVPFHEIGIEGHKKIGPRPNMPLAAKIFLLLEQAGADQVEDANPHVGHGKPSFHLNFRVTCLRVHGVGMLARADEIFRNCARRPSPGRDRQMGLTVRRERKGEVKGMGGVVRVDRGGC